MRKGEREERLAATLRAVLVVGIVLALAAASYFPFSHFLRLSEARSAVSYTHLTLPTNSLV